MQAHECTAVISVALVVFVSLIVEFVNRPYEWVWNVRQLRSYL
jgi:hypothetical protein